MARKLDRDFLDNIAQLATALRQQIDAGFDGWDAGAEAIAERRRRVLDPAGGYEFFDRHYFPHYGTAEPSELHRYFYQRVPQILASPAGQRDAIAAPRGEAKTTKLMTFMLWCVLTKAKHYPLIFSDAFEQAAEMLEALKAELDSNPRIAIDFPEAAGRGRVWKNGVILTATGIKIEAFGVGKRVRGRRHGPYRPDLAVLDDVENDENAATPAQRDKLQRFITRAVLSLGPVDDSMDVLMAGTVLGFDSVLSRFLKHPMWNSKVVKAIARWPDRMDLWDRFEELLLNAETPQAGDAAARALYSAHKAEMDAGAVVSWPAVRPLVSLMIKRARDGHDAFDSEQQNDPTAGDDAPFARCITFWVNRLSDWLFYGACDPSMGRAGSGRDPSAVLVGGYSRATGVLDVVHASIHRRLPDRLISDIIEAQREFFCLVWGFEAVVFAEFIRTELVKRSAEAAMPVPARPLVPIADKALRIESLQPHMANGLIRLHPGQSTLIEQLRHYPKADHDDGPDALQMLWALAVSGGVAAGAQTADPASRASQSYRQRAARQAQRMFGWSRR